MTETYVKSQLNLGKNWLKENGLYDHYRFKFIYPKPSKSKITYPYFVMVKISNGHQKMIGKADSVTGLISAFKTMYCIE